jgi:hypothetical protein
VHLAPLTTTIGTEVDLADDLSDEVIANVRDALRFV